MAPVREKSQQQNCVTLSVTEAEMVAACKCAQDMMHVRSVMESMELQVRSPIILYVDNRSVVNLVNSWSVGG